MRISVLTICPEQFGDFQKTPVIQRAVAKELLQFDIVDMRDFADGCFRKVDDSPYGGGAGMLLRCEPVIDALESVRTPESHSVILAPVGKTYSQKDAHRLAEYSHLILICGHYEGFDARIFPYADETLSIGDYILTGGELPAMVMADSVVRLLKGNLKEESTREESFEQNLLEYPQYTHPYEYRGQKVPDILLSGNHEEIQRWRKQQAEELTRQNRPDLL